MARNRLLNRLNVDSLGRASLNLTTALKKGFSSGTWVLIQAVRLEAERQNLPLFVVGGFVRDLLLGQPNLDLDLVVQGDAIRLGRVLVKQFGGSLLPHKAFGTAVWSLDGDRAKIFQRLRLSKKQGPLPEFIDLISARRESYARPGALPDVEFADIHADQYRRDFTINTLALRLDGPAAGNLLDPWRGLADLRTGLLRTLHAKSFADDPTRILRILRLAGRLEFKIEADTLKQLTNSLHFLDLVSGERIYRELVLVLLEGSRVKILKAMEQKDVLKAIEPNLEFNIAMAKTLRSLPTPSKDWQIDGFASSDLGFVLWLLPLGSQKAGSVCDRLRLPQSLRRAVLSAAQLRSELKSLQKFSPSKLVARLEKEPILTLYALYLSTPAGAAKIFKGYVSKWRHVFQYTDGDLLRKKGLKPGPAYGQILSRLRAAWLDDAIKTKKEEQALLDRLLSEYR